MIQEYGLSDFPIGIRGCKISDNHFDSCVNDVVVFDEKSEPTKLIEFENEFVIPTQSQFKGNVLSLHEFVKFCELLPL